MRLLVALLCVVVPAAAFGADDAAQSPPQPLTEAEQAFVDQMSGATLVGNFTVGALNTDDGGNAKPERYEIGQVKKLGGGNWLIPARIKYGENDVTLPITLPVKWAGDTAVIIVDKIGFPGLGEYSSRVLIHNGRYAGYWHGGGHGGHLFGVIERPGEADEK